VVTLWIDDVASLAHRAAARPDRTTSRQALDPPPTTLPADVAPDLVIDGFGVDCPNGTSPRW
jgi:hypothetical protein